MPYLTQVKARCWRGLQGVSVHGYLHLFRRTAHGDLTPQTQKNVAGHMNRSTINPVEHMG